MARAPNSGPSLQIEDEFPRSFLLRSQTRERHSTKKLEDRPRNVGPLSIQTPDMQYKRRDK